MYYFKAKSKGTNVIHNLRRCSFMKKSPFYVTGNLVIVMQFISQSVPKTSQNPRHAKAQGHVESLKLYSILWFDWSTSKQKAMKQGPWTTSPYHHCLGSSTLSAVRHLELFMMMVIYVDHSWTTKLNQGGCSCICSQNSGFYQCLVHNNLRFIHVEVKKAQFISGTLY